MKRFMKKTWTVIFFWFTAIPLLYGQTSTLHINQINDIQFQSTPYHFAIIGDRTGEGSDPWAVFDSAIQQINDRNPDFVVMIGDIIQGGARGDLAVQSRWQEAFRHLEKLVPPLFMIPGNHDINSQTTYEIWRRNMGNTYFRFVYGDNLFLFLNTEEGYGGHGRGFGKEQLAFINASLDSISASGEIFIFMHRPPWLEKGPLNSQWTTIEKKLEGKRFSLVTGHLHVLGEKVDEGNRYLIVGPTGGKMRLARNPSLGMVQHYTWVEVKKDTSSFQFIENGTVLSEASARAAYARGVRTLRFLMSQ